VKAGNQVKTTRRSGTAQPIDLTRKSIYQFRTGCTRLTLDIYLAVMNVNFPGEYRPHSQTPFSADLTTTRIYR
jgi:hypothetical protein